jgi:predicted ferric reductase
MAAPVTGVLASSGPSVQWYLTRSTGVVSLLLLTAAVVLGVADVRRFSTPSWPRFVVDSLHRSVSLLALAFLVVHIVTSLLDSFTSISLLDAIVPFAGSYRPFWLGLGAVAFDLMLAVIITSLLRARIGFTGWRAVHWLAYASWPVALIHGLGTGSDVKSGWMLVVSVLCTLSVIAAVLLRVFSGWPSEIARRRGALAATGAFSVFLLAWLPLGPLGSEWARRSGTPSSLLGHTSSSATGHAGR